MQEAGLDVAEAPHTLVFLHGLGQRPDAWLPQVLAVPDGWRVRTPWIRGLKPVDQEPFDLDLAAETLVQTLELEGIVSYDIVGLSVGAAVAVRIAARYRDRVSRLVLVSGQGSPPKLMLKLQLAVMRRTPEEKFLAQGIPKSAAIHAFETLARLDLAADMRKVAAPTLVVHGASDTTNEPASRILAAGIKGAEIVTVEGGHALNETSPEALNDAIFGFLRPSD